MLVITVPLGTSPLASPQGAHTGMFTLPRTRRCRDVCRRQPGQPEELAEPHAQGHRGTPLWSLRILRFASFLSALYE